ncbi:MAG: phosphate ABC transporter ATP-binding protein PstB, partial [Longimicrobiales bacterium]|nr:phosphate ABC transporter ATP-binding protein PstB [Longimicrobiales bacterium]
MQRPVPDSPAGDAPTEESHRTAAGSSAIRQKPTTTELSDGERVSTTYDIDTGGRAPALEARDVSVHYGSNRAVNDISLVVPANQVVALIGPSGCGKSTLLRCFNRMNDLVQEARVDGEVLFHGENLYDPEVDPVEVRRRIGMVFQKPNPFPKSIYDNVAFGPRVNGFKGDLDALVETSLRQSALWDEVHDRLGDLAYNLSGGQQQRLCIARTLAVKPEIVLMDEPASALDPIATQRIEDLIYQLKEQYTIVIVTHNMQQAARISDYTAFLYMG